MKLALSLAKRGGRKVSPNPMVGCIIVRNGRIVGKGYHEYFGGPHAEVRALKSARKKAFGSTMYISLEPCNHDGKTPPCTDAIIKAGVSRVVVAVQDPNPRTKGKGMEKLERHSIKVSEGTLATEARSLNAAYFKIRRQRGRKVIVKYAMSADGKIATRTGDSKWISSTRSRSYVHELRSRVDAIIVGARTAIRDNPQLTSHRRGRNPVRVVIDPRLRVPLSNNVFDDAAPTIVFHNSSGVSGKLSLLRKRRVLTVRLPGIRGRMSFKDILRKLHDFSLDRILIEGGGETIAEALAADIVTDVAIIVAPKIIGGKTATTPVEGLGIADVRNALRIIDTRIEKIGCDFLLTAKVVRRKRLEWR